MNYLAVFGISFTVALSGALMPGPLLTTVIAASAKHGFKSGPFMIAGHAILEAAMVGLILVGLAGLILRPAVMATIAIIGSGILFYFGIDMLRSSRRLSLDPTGAAPSASNLVVSGITVSLANPYWTIWWLTIGLGFVLAAHKGGLLAVAVFFAGHITADLGWYSLVSWGVSRGKKFISDGVYRGLILVCAVLLLGFAVSFLFGAFSLHASSG